MAVGLDYQGARAGLDLAGIAVTPELWAQLRVIEAAARGAHPGAADQLDRDRVRRYVDAGVWKYMTTNPATLYQQGQGSHQWYIAASGTAGASIALSQAMQLDPSGNLLVGTTTYGGIGVSLNPVGGQIINYSGTGTNTMIEFKNSNGTVGYISSSGTATSYNQSSDRRLKTKITDATEAGSVIDLIKVRSFDWKADGSHQRFGFIAQELVRVAPEAVTMPENPDAIWAVDYSKLVPMLTKEIQSLRRRMTALEAA